MQNITITNTNTLQTIEVASDIATPTMSVTERKVRAKNHQVQFFASRYYWAPISFTSTTEACDFIADAEGDCNIAYSNYDGNVEINGVRISDDNSTLYYNYAILED